MRRKLNKPDVFRIRMLLAAPYNLKPSKIAPLFGVTVETILHIQNGRTWKGV